MRDYGFWSFNIGYGDSLIVTSEVKKAKLKFPHRAVVVGDGTEIKWCPVFDNNPKISKSITSDCVWVRSVKGNRPYIDYSQTTKARMVWNYRFHVEPGEIYLTDHEKNWSDRDFVYIEPNTKGSFSGNKDWGFDNWQKVVNALPGIRFIQGSGRRLANVEQRATASFRHACGLLSHASLFVGTDGGLHHAAAALGKRAVVVWGGLAPPSVLGYDTHVNLCKAKSWCGSQGKCEHCRKSMNDLSIEEVVESIRNLVDCDQGPTKEV